MPALPRAMTVFSGLPRISSPPAAGGQASREEPALLAIDACPAVFHVTAQWFSVGSGESRVFGTIDAAAAPVSSTARTKEPEMTGRRPAGVTRNRPHVLRGAPAPNGTANHRHPARARTRDQAIHRALRSGGLPGPGILGVMRTVARGPRRDQDSGPAGRQRPTAHRPEQRTDCPVWMFRDTGRVTEVRVRTARALPRRRRARRPSSARRTGRAGGQRRPRQPRSPSGPRPLLPLPALTAHPAATRPCVVSRAERARRRDATRSPPLP